MGRSQGDEPGKGQSMVPATMQNAKDALEGQCDRLDFPDGLFLHDPAEATQVPRPPSGPPPVRRARGHRGVLTENDLPNLEIMRTSKNSSPRRYKEPPARQLSADDLQNQDIKDALPAGHIEKLLEGTSWHLANISASFSSIPISSKGLVVLASLSNLEALCNYVVACNESKPELLIVAVILCAPKSTSDVTAILQMQLRLIKAGADDVIGHPGDGEDLRLSLGLAFQRTLVNRQKSKSAQAQVGRFSQMFWCVAHRVIPGFPKGGGEEGALTGRMLEGQHIGAVELGPLLGRGTFGTVYLGVNKSSGEDEAVKVFEKDSLNSLNKVMLVWQEASVVNQLSHPHIAKFLGLRHLPNHITFHMEFAGARNLQDFAVDAGGRLDLATAWTVGKQLLEALTHCHQHQIAHRDIKHQNIAVSTSNKGEVITKLVDFGLATKARGPDAMRRCGSMPFCAPEVLLLETPSSGELDATDPRRADVWAAGVVLMELVGGLGLMLLAMGWERHCLEPTEDRGRQLLDVFGGRSWARPVLEAAAAKAKSSGQDEDGEPVCPLAVLSCGRLLEVLTKMLHPDPLARGSCKELASMVGSNEHEPAAQRLGQPLPSEIESAAEASRADESEMLWARNFSEQLPVTHRATSVSQTSCPHFKEEHIVEQPTCTRGSFLPTPAQFFCSDQSTSRTSQRKQTETESSLPPVATFTTSAKARKQLERFLRK